MPGSLLGKLLENSNLNLGFVAILVPMIGGLLIIGIYSAIRHIEKKKMVSYISLYASIYTVYFCWFIGPWWWAIIVAPVMYFIMKGYMNTLLRISKADLLGPNKNRDKHQDNEQSKKDKNNHNEV